MRYIYNFKNRNCLEYNISSTIATHENYEFVILDTGDVGMINTTTGKFISDKFDSYAVGERTYLTQQDFDSFEVEALDFKSSHTFEEYALFLKKRMHEFLEVGHNEIMTEYLKKHMEDSKSIIKLREKKPELFQQ